MRGDGIGGTGRWAGWLTSFAGGRSGNLSGAGGGATDGTGTGGLSAGKAANGRSPERSGGGSLSVISATTDPTNPSPLAGTRMSVSRSASQRRLTTSDLRGPTGPPVFFSARAPQISG